MTSNPDTNEGKTMSVHKIGLRVRMRAYPEVTGTVVELMASGFDIRVKWDDGRRRGRFDGWVSWTSIEAVPSGDSVDVSS